MKNSTIKKIIKILFTIMQALILIAPLLLQYLSNKKMGVKRYLVFKNAMFSKGAYTTHMIFALKTILILGSVICIVLLIRYYLKKKSDSCVRSLFMATLINITANFFVFLKGFEKLLGYHFFLIAIFIIIVIQYLKIALCNKNI